MERNFKAYNQQNHIYETIVSMIENSLIQSFRNRALKEKLIALYEIY